MKRLRSVRYAVGDIIYVIGRFFAAVGRALWRVPVAIARGTRRFWGSLSVIARRRLVAAVAVGAGLLILFSVVVPNLPCQFPGGDGCPPGDDAEELVPADSLAYLHANLDPETEQYAAAAELGDQLPLIGGELADRALALVGAGGAGAEQFAADVRPWFGGEAAVVVLEPAGAVAERVELLEVADPDGASAYATELAVGDVETAEFEGVEVSVDQRDVATAQIEGFLAVGTEAGVRSVIATATGADGADSLADDATAQELREQLPEHRFAEAWLAPGGVEDLVAADAGTLGTLTPLLGPGATQGAAASLSADDGELELAIRSALDPEREDSATFFGLFPPFEPTLTERLRPETLAYLGFGSPPETISALLSQAGAQAPGIAAAFGDLVRSLQRDANVDVQGELIDALGEQAALALVPGAQGDAAFAPPPYGLLLAAGVDEDRARQGLAALAAPLSQGAERPADGQAPTFGQEEIDGVETNTVRISPTLELTYAVFDGLAAVATAPAGVAGAIAGEGGLDQAARFERATEGFPGEVAMQVYLDLEGLVRAGEEAGLAEDPVYATFAGEFRRLDALAAAVTDADDVLATDARLVIGPESEAELPAAPSD